MKYFFFLLCCLCLQVCHAQKNIPPTEAFRITGEIHINKEVSLVQLGGLRSNDITNTAVTNHAGVVKDKLRDLKGILLKTILNDLDYISESPKDLSELTFHLIASDGYRVVYSWNEIFNTQTGDHIFILTQKYGKSLSEMEDRIAVVCTSDFMTGRRFVKGLERIEVRR